jgi:hypothetical protein
MDSYLGVPESNLVSGMGPPQNVYQAPDGSRILSFSRSGNMQLGGATTYQPVTSTTNGTLYGNGGTATYRGATTSYQAVQQPTYNVPLSCSVNFTLRNDRVVGWQASGNHCVN